MSEKGYTYTVLKRPEFARNKGDRPALWRIIAAVMREAEDSVEE